MVTLFLEEKKKNAELEMQHDTCLLAGCHFTLAS